MLYLKKEWHHLETAYILQQLLTGPWQNFTSSLSTHSMASSTVSADFCHFIQHLSGGKWEKEGSLWPTIAWLWLWDTSLDPGGIMCASWMFWGRWQWVRAPLARGGFLSWLSVAQVLLGGLRHGRAETSCSHLLRYGWGKCMLCGRPEYPSRWGNSLANISAHFHPGPFAELSSTVETNNLGLLSLSVIS